MDKVDVKLKCLEIAAAKRIDPRETMHIADSYYQFVTGEKPVSKLMPELEQHQGPPPSAVVYEPRGGRGQVTDNARIKP